MLLHQLYLLDDVMFIYNNIMIAIVLLENGDICASSSYSKRGRAKLRFGVRTEREREGERFGGRGVGSEAWGLEVLD